MDLVIFDLETTGLLPTMHDIIQIAAVRMSFGAVLHKECYSTFVNPGYRISPFITSYTGISNSNVRNAPSVATALSEFSRFVGGTTVLAHNGHRFDMPFIRAACMKTGLATRTVNYADSIHLSRGLWTGTRKHGLDAIIERLSLSTRVFRRHDARGDVGILAEAVKRMWRKLDPDRTRFPAPLFTSVFPQ